MQFGLLNMKNANVVHLKGNYLFRLSTPFMIMAQTVVALCCPLVVQTLYHMCYRVNLCFNHDAYLHCIPNYYANYIFL